MKWVVYNIDYDLMYCTCSMPRRKQRRRYRHGLCLVQVGNWERKVKGDRNREGATEKWKFFLELNEEDAKDSVGQKGRHLKERICEQRQYPEEFMEMMTRESGMVASEEAKGERFNEYMQDKLQLLGTVQPGGVDELPELEYTAILHLRRKWQQQQAGEEGQRGEEEESEAHYPPPNDAADSDCRALFGDSQIPGGDFTLQEQFELMHGRRDQAEAAYQEIQEYQVLDELREERESARGDVDMENAELPEASTTPTSLVEHSFSTNMVDELRDGVEPHARIVVEL